MKKITAIAALAALFLTGCSGTRPSGLGVTDGRLSSCPESPNCVSSQSEIPDRFIEPISYSGKKDNAMAALEEILVGMDRVRVIEKSRRYLYVESTSRVFRFVDDVEFYFPEDAQVIHVRSASRIGYSDLGVNQKRVDAIRAALQKALAVKAGNENQ